MYKYTKCQMTCRFTGSPLTQSAARNFCENELEVPAHLVEINTEEENDAILCELDRLGHSSGQSGVSYWIGITDRHTEGKWELESNGQSVIFTNWDQTEPNNHEKADGKCHGSTACLRARLSAILC